MKTVILDTKKEKSIVVKVDSDTQYVLVPEDKASVEFVLEKDNVSCELLVIYKLSKKAAVDINTISKHTALNTSCFVKVKGVLYEKAFSNYVGTIKIGRHAQNTSSFLEDAVLVLGKGARNHSQPILEIENDDVRASHSATTGRVDKEQVYYLMSRGLSEKEAEEVVIEGFLEDLVSEIIDEDIQEIVKKKIYGKK